MHISDMDTDCVGNPLYISNDKLYIVMRETIFNYKCVVTCELLETITWIIIDTVCNWYCILKQQLNKHRNGLQFYSYKVASDNLACTEVTQIKAFRVMDYI